jgi:nitrate reductase NapD
MHVAGIIVRTRPEHVEQVRGALCRLEGVEVHTATAEGRLVVTVESDDRDHAAARFGQLQELPQVLSAALVYEQSETDSGN